MIEYLIKSTISLAALYFCSVILVRKSTNYKIIRILLVFSIVYSLIIPFLNISIPDFVEKELGTVNLNNTFSNVSILYTPSTVDSENLIINNITIRILFIIYLTISIILLIRFLYNFSQLISQIKISNKTSIDGEQIILVSGNQAPYSFFKSIFISKSIFDNGNFDKDLLLHEIAHKKQLHSIDTVFVELLIVFFWFNPFIYLFKKLIKSNHEYLADDYVIKSGVNKEKYSSKLIDYTFRNKTLNLASGFDYLLIKNRITMLAKNEQKKRFTFSMAILPVIIFAILLLSTAFINSDGVFNLNPTEKCVIETYRNEKMGGYIINGDKQELFFRDEGNRGYIYYISKKGGSFLSNTSDTVIRRVGDFEMKEYKGKIFVDNEYVGSVKKGDYIILHYNKEIDVYNSDRVIIKKE